MMPDLSAVDEEDEMDHCEALDAVVREHQLIVAFLANDYPEALAHYFTTRGWITLH